MSGINLFGLSVKFRVGEETGWHVTTARELHETLEEAMAAAPDMIRDLKECHAGELRDVSIEYPQFSWDPTPTVTSFDAIDKLLAESAQPEVAEVKGGEGVLRKGVEQYIAERVKGFKYGPNKFEIHFHNGGFLQINVAPDGSNLQVAWPNEQPKTIDVDPGGMVM